MNHRVRRVEETLKTVLTEIIEFELSDPDQPDSLTITSVKVASDLQHAKIYFVQSPSDDDAINATYGMFDRAKGFFRSSIAEALDMRHTPDLEFFYDEAYLESKKIDDLIAESKRQLGKDPNAPLPAEPEED
ncbi:MAG: 30S ribosome-binding factor RbfA [Candidatus Sumerlaeia bacterium]|nr:30S ribosome-binding factor RbfA [Candidatus Sumerlaeia bacterium]